MNDNKCNQDECICWYYETGESKSEYTKKKTVSLLLPGDISTVSILNKLFR